MEVCSLLIAVLYSFVWICPALGYFRLLHFADQKGIKWHCAVGLLCVSQLTKDDE